jgi:hypothetical protein
MLLLFVFRFALLLLRGHQALAIENAALRMQLAAFQRKRKPDGKASAWLLGDAVSGHNRQFVP